MSNHVQQARRVDFTQRIEAELTRAYAKHGTAPWSRHEFYGIILEEFEEMWDDIKADAPLDTLDKEIVQVAAMCFRFFETRVTQPEAKPVPGYYPDEDVFITGTGQRIVSLHQRNEDCLTYGCVIHNPTLGPMADWPTHWRGDRGIMERLCPMHGVGHPDRDGLNWLERRFGVHKAYDEGVHGCCGCCGEGA